MTLEHLTHELAQLTESELDEVARYVSFVKLRERLHPLPPLGEAELAAMYAEAAQEDRTLAEAGLADYTKSLASEDAR